MRAYLLQQRADSTSYDVSFVPGRNDHGDLNWPFVPRILLCWHGGIDAPKAAARKHKINPNRKAENSGGNEHLRYCTVHRNSEIVFIVGVEHWSASAPS